MQGYYWISTLPLKEGFLSTGFGIISFSKDLCLAVIGRLTACSLNHACSRASSGVIRVIGFQSRLPA